MKQGRWRRVYVYVVRIVRWVLWTTRMSQEMRKEMRNLMSMDFLARSIQLNCRISCWETSEETRRTTTGIFAGKVEWMKYPEEIVSEVLVALRLNEDWELPTPKQVSWLTTKKWLKQNNHTNHQRTHEEKTKKKKHNNISENARVLHGNCVVGFTLAFWLQPSLSLHIRLRYFIRYYRLIIIIILQWRRDEEAVVRLF